MNAARRSARRRQTILGAMGRAQSPYAPPVQQAIGGRGEGEIKPSLSGEMEKWKKERRRKRREREREGPQAKDHGTTPDGVGIPSRTDNWVPA